MTGEIEAFLGQILEERDRLFRENSKLRGQVSSYEGFEAEKTSLKAQISEKDQVIVALQQQIQMLKRKIWGKSSERFIKPDPQQRRLDFEGLELLPEEKELADTAKEEIEQCRKKRTKAKPKKKPVRKPVFPS